MPKRIAAIVTTILLWTTLFCICYARCKEIARARARAWAMHKRQRWRWQSRKRNCLFVIARTGINAKKKESQSPQHPIELMKCKNACVCMCLSVCVHLNSEPGDHARLLHLSRFASVRGCSIFLSFTKVINCAAFPMNAPATDYIIHFSSAHRETVKQRPESTTRFTMHTHNNVEYGVHLWFMRASERLFSIFSCAQCARLWLWLYARLHNAHDHS